MLEWIVTSQESGSKLISFLTARLEEKYSARFLKRLIEQNNCEINGRTQRFASSPLKRGDHVSLRIEQASYSSPYTVEEKRIIYEDDVLLVYNKPAGINSDERGILRVLKARTPSLQLVHRLDRDTTGVLILAKQPAAFENLVKQFKQFQVRKRYQTIVDGIVDSPKGIIENYLGKKKAYAGQTLWGVVSSSRGLYACTEWRRVKKGRMASLLECSPKTGRTHQIRVHMAQMGHPILGDFQYGKHFQCPYRPFRYLLHAVDIHFLHPVTGAPLCLTSPLPDDFKMALQKLFKSGKS
jgi:RluA family pseudouridine synthase